MQQQSPYPPSYQPYAPPPPQKPPRRRRGGFMRFVRGYLMLVGACTTIMGLIWLLVYVFVELGKFMPPLV